MKNLIFKLPLSIKILFSKIRNLFRIGKFHIINKTIRENKNNSNFNKDNKNFIKSLKSFLKSNMYSKQETTDFLNYLYNDKINLINDVAMDYSNPVIICVVKNDIIRIKHFIKHHRDLGFSNFIFIDNGSTDGTLEFLIDNNCLVYQVLETYSTNRRVSWIMNIKNTIPDNCWVCLLDSDELLVYKNYEKIKINEVFENLDKKNIIFSGAVMLDMFAIDNNFETNEYLNYYRFFDNDLYLTKSYYFNSIYGGIRGRVFNSNGSKREYLIKKHPIMKSNIKYLYCHAHYSFPYKLNFKSDIYFAILHYKFFDRDINKYKEIIRLGNYANNSEEYKKYIDVLSSNEYNKIFTISDKTVEYTGTKSLNNITFLKDITF